MYKNFKLTDEERKQIMEHHKMHGYKKPLKEDAPMGGAPEDDTSTGGGPDYCGWEYGPKLGFNFNNDGGGDISAWWDKEVNGFNLHGIDDSDQAYFTLSISREHTDKQPVSKNVINSITSIVTSMGGKYNGMNAYGTWAIFIFPHGGKSKNCKAYFDSCAKVVQFLKGVKTGKSLKEQGEPQTGGGPKPNVPDIKSLKTTDPKYGKNIKQPERLVGKKATFYKNPEDAKMAYQAGKSNPQSEGSIIATIGDITSTDQKNVTFSVILDSTQSNYSMSRHETVIYFSRMNGTFTISQPEKIAGTYYSESVKNILNDEFFSTELASNNKPQQTNMAEEIDTDDEEAELSRLYNDEDEYSYDLDSDVENGHFSSEFSDPDEWEDLHDFSVAKHRLPKDRMDDMGRSVSKDMDYKGAKHHNEIPGAQRDNIQDYPTWDSRFVPKQKNSDSDYYLRTYGTPDPDMELQTLADLKKNQPLNFPKYTDKDRRDRENLLSWEEKKKLMAQRAEKKAARELARQARQGRMNESIQLTESELVNLIKKIINEAK